MCCKEKDKQMLVNKVNRLFAIIWQAESSIHRKEKTESVYLFYRVKCSLVTKKNVYNNILIDDCTIYWTIKKLQRFEVHLWNHNVQQNFDIFNLEIEDQLFLFNLVFQNQRVTLGYTNISHFYRIKICLYNYIELWHID